MLVGTHRNTHGSAATYTAPGGPSETPNEHMEHPEGEVVFRHSCQLGLSKRLGSRYRSGRSPDWLAHGEKTSLSDDSPSCCRRPIFSGMPNKRFQLTQEDGERTRKRWENFKAHPMGLREAIRIICEVHPADSVGPQGFAMTSGFPRFREG
jgi:hypothetical protein